MASDNDLLGRTEVVLGARAAFDALIALAFKDPTTGLNNRRALDEIAKVALGFRETIYGVVMIDLSGFKRVNDLGSHAAGDAALRVVGETLVRMCSSPSSPGLPFRYGGDEFCILVASQAFESFVEAENLRQLSWLDFSIDGTALGFGASIGYVPPDQELGLLALIDRADSAAKASKHRNDEPVRWTETLERAKLITWRRRCAGCSATLSIQVIESSFNANALSSCGNCGRPYDP